MKYSCCQRSTPGDLLAAAGHVEDVANDPLGIRARIMDPPILRNLQEFQNGLLRDIVGIDRADVTAAEFPACLVRHVRVQGENLLVVRSVDL